MQLYYPEGMRLHGENALKYCGYTPYIDRTLPAIFWLYFADDYEMFKSHEGPKYVYWHNSDVRILYNGFMHEIPELIKAKHACHNSLLQEELAYVGIYAEIAPFFYNDFSKYKPEKKSERVKVFCTTNPGREFEYGVGYIMALSQRFQDIQFHVFGTDGDNTENLTFHGWIPEDEMDELTKDMHICIRMNKHDGVPQTCIKAMLREQIVLAYLDIIGDMWETTNIEMLSFRIKESREYKELIIKDQNRFIKTLNRKWYE